MNTTPHPLPVKMGSTTMIDRAEAEAALYRVAVSAFTYYPGKETDEPGYRVDEDVDWCAAPLIGIPTPQLEQIRVQIRLLITDPLADRQAFIASLGGLAGE